MPVTRQIAFEAIPLRPLRYLSAEGWTAQQDRISPDKSATSSGEGDSNGPIGAATARFDCVVVRRASLQGRHTGAAKATPYALHSCDARLKPRPTPYTDVMRGYRAFRLRVVRRASLQGRHTGAAKATPYALHSCDARLKPRPTPYTDVMRGYRAFRLRVVRRASLQGRHTGAAKATPYALHRCDARLKPRPTLYTAVMRGYRALRLRCSP